MRVALLLAPLFEGATPGDPFAWFHSDALPMPGETISQGGVVWQVAMRALTVNDENPDNPHAEYGLMVRKVGAVPKLAALSETAKGRA